MLDTSKISAAYLCDVAANLGWEGDRGDTIPDEYLEQIRRMDARSFVRCFAGWHLGSKDWGDIFLSVINAARSAEEEKAEIAG